MNKTAIIQAALQHRRPNELIELAKLQRECNELFGNKEQQERYKKATERKNELSRIIANERVRINRELNIK